MSIFNELLAVVYSVLFENTRENGMNIPLMIRQAEREQVPSHRLPSSQAGAATVPELVLKPTDVRERPLPGGGESEGRIRVCSRIPSPSDR